MRKIRAILENFLFPHLVTPCTRCHQPAGVWVYAAEAKTVRRPWCLSCLDDLPHEGTRAVSFEGIPLWG